MRTSGLRQAIQTLVVAAAAMFGLSPEAHALACSVTAFTGAYGTVNPLPGTAVNSTATFSVTCSGGTANQGLRFCMNIGPGSTTTGPASERVIRSASDYMDHEFYSNSGRTLLWGSWGIGSSPAYPSGSPAGNQQDVTLDASGNGTFNYTVFAKILAGQQDTIPGSFTWSGGDPTVQYRALTGSSACPNGGGSASGGSSSFTATVNARCTISATALSFGSSNSTISSNIDSTATLTATCTNSTPYSIGLNNGANVSGTQRRMRLGATANFISYGLYTDSARTNGWKTTTSTTSCTGGASTCILGTGTGSSQNVTVYGRIPPQTAPAAGSFTDTVTVTVTY